MQANLRYKSQPGFISLGEGERKLLKAHELKHMWRDIV